MTDDRNVDKADDAEFIEQISARLENEIDDLPESAALRLQQMRRHAAGLAERKPGLLATRRVPILIATAAMAALAVFMDFSSGSRIPALPVGSEAEFALAQELELVEELEFLAWLEEEPLDAG